MKIDLKIIVVILGLFVIFLFLFYAEDIIGINAEVRNDYLIVLPGLSSIVIGCLLLASNKSTFIIPGVGGIGLGLVILLGEMNDAGIVVDKWVAGGFSLIGLQGFCIVCMIIVGAIILIRR